MPPPMLTILNLLMSSGGEYASVLDRVHCIHYLTDFLTDFSHLRNTLPRGDAFTHSLKIPNVVLIPPLLHLGSRQQQVSRPCCVGKE